MAFDTCASSGCHRYHDNRALYEDFLAQRLDQAALLDKRTLRARDFRAVAEQLPDYPRGRYPLKPLARGDADAPPAAMARAGAVDDWLATAHAAAGVNCSGCHEARAHGEAAATWVERPNQDVCTACHQSEAKGFLAGRHGMRLAEGLAPMTPARARIPMRSEAHGTALGCTTCHGAHRFDTRKAAVEACLGCHRDEHSLAYEKSPHAALWRKEIAGQAPAGSGVSCASCHMPRLAHELADLGLTRTLVQHNQNDTLRPNDKMLRPVCLECHGLGFAFDALADRQSIAANFSGSPRVHVKSLEMVAERARQQEQRRRERVAQSNSGSAAR
jgi:predicted CXXCH cytochrome family protein